MTTVDFSKPYSDMTEDERARAGELVSRWQAERPVAAETAIVPTFDPGVIFFQDGQFQAVSPDVGVAWPFIEPTLESLLRLMPRRHRLGYWKERIESGATLALAFVETGTPHPFDAGMLNCDITDDGKRTIAVFIRTFAQLDLNHAARIAETAALALGAEQVHLWTPIPVPIVPGYRLEQCWSGQMQVIDVEPIQ